LCKNYIKKIFYITILNVNVHTFIISTKTTMEVALLYSIIRVECTSSLISGLNDVLNFNLWNHCMRKIILNGAADSAFLSKYIIDITFMIGCNIFSKKILHILSNSIILFRYQRKIQYWRIAKWVKYKI